VDDGPTTAVRAGKVREDSRAMPFSGNGTPEVAGPPCAGVHFFHFSPFLSFVLSFFHSLLRLTNLRRQTPTQQTRPDRLGPVRRSVRLLHDVCKTAFGVFIGMDVPAKLTC
jgi:hypothetical protein